MPDPRPAGSAPDSDPDPALDSPSRWLSATPLLDLEDPRIRVRVRSLTQLCKSEREKVLALYAFVKRFPFSKPLKLHLRTAREVLDAGKGDAIDKATLLVALLRAARVPARLHYVELRGLVMRGLTNSLTSAARPVLEVWVQDRWVATDTYIFDAGYMAAARQRLREQDWDVGYGIHRDGHAIWNGIDPAWVNAVGPQQDPMFLEDHGLFHDPREFVESPAYRRNHTRLARAMHWNVIAPSMERAIRELRDGRGPARAPAERKA